MPWRNDYYYTSQLMMTGWISLLILAWTLDFPMLLLILLILGKKNGTFLVLTSHIIYGRKLNISVFASQDAEQWNHPAHTLVPLGNISLLPNVEPNTCHVAPFQGSSYWGRLGVCPEQGMHPQSRQGLLPKSPPKHHFVITKCTHVLLKGRQKWSKSLD